MQEQMGKSQIRRWEAWGLTKPLILAASPHSCPLFFPAPAQHPPTSSEESHALSLEPGMSGL